MLRFTFPRLLALLVATALVGYTFFVAPRLEGAGGLDGRPPPVDWRAEAAQPGRPEFPPVGKAFLGLTTAEGWHSFAPVDAFATATGYRPSVMMFTAGWAVDRFDRRGFDEIAGRGMLPTVSWEPWDHRSRAGADNARNQQPAYALSRIIKGEYDNYIRTYARGIRSLDYQVGIRLAHEMNGFWYPWSEQSNGNRPGEYARMWRHVHDLFTEVGALNAVWIWSPNVSYTNSTPLPSLYPGDDYVDWVGMSGYYGTEGVENYRGFRATFDSTIQELRRFARKPIVLTEVGATDVAGRKAEWIGDLFANLPAYPDIIGMIYFEAVREDDWRLVKAPDAVAVYSAAAADERYDVDWMPTTVARLRTPIPSAAASPSPSVAPRTTPGTSSSRSRATPRPSRSQRS